MREHPTAAPALPTWSIAAAFGLHDLQLGSLSVTMRGGASESLQDLPLHFHYFKNRLKITPKNTVVLMHPNQTPVFYVVDVKGLSTFPSWTSRVRVPSPAPTFQSLAHLAKSALVSFVSIKARWLRFYFNGSVSKRQAENTASIRYRGASAESPAKGRRHARVLPAIEARRVSLAWMRGAGRGVFDPLRQQRGQQQEGAAADHGGHAVVPQKVIHNPPEAQGCQDLRRHDEEVEDPHVKPDAFGGQGTGQHGIGHGERAGPRDSHTGHGEQQQILVMDYGHRKQAQGARHEADAMRPPPRQRACHGL